MYLARNGVNAANNTYRHTIGVFSLRRIVLTPDRLPTPTRTPGLLSPKSLPATPFCPISMMSL